MKESACPSKLWSQARTSLSPPAMEANGIFLQRKEGRSALFFSAATFVHRLSWIFRAVCCLPLHFRGMEAASSRKPHEPTSANLELSFCRLLPLSLHRLRRVRASLRASLRPKGMWCLASPSTQTTAGVSTAGTLPVPLGSSSVSAAWLTGLSQLSTRPPHRAWSFLALDLK